MSQISQVKDATNIVEIIGESITLSRSGSSFRGLCPFHQEKTPSFFVNDQIQRYRCFGCGESGDVLQFLIKHEGMSFGEAMETLAARAGIELTEYRQSADDQERTKLLEITSLAKQYYHYLLTEHKAGKAARQYLKQRGINSQSIKLFQLGFALDKWDGLIQFLHKKKKYSLVDIQKTGLILLGRGRHYDRFRGRIIFPLNNHRGQVVGFSGRVMESDVKEAKYINSPETALYHKSQMLYGFSELFSHIKKEKQVIVVEGEFDVISSAQAHVNNIVAIKGSALTEQQVRLIERAADKVVLALDNDKAGVEATKRAITIIKKSKLELRVLDMGLLGKDLGAKDVDDIARANPKQWREVSNKSISAYQFLLNIALASVDPKSPEGKRQVMMDMAPVISEIPLEVEKDFYVGKLSEKLNVSKRNIEQDLRSLDRSGQKKVIQKKETLVEDNEKTRLEKYLLFLLLNTKDAKVEGLAKDFGSVKWSLVGSKELLAGVSSAGPTFKWSNLIKSLAADVQETAMEWQHQPQYFENLEKIDQAEEWAEAIAKYKRLDLKDEITKINHRIEEIDKIREKTDEDEMEMARLLEKIVKLRK